MSNVTKRSHEPKIHLINLQLQTCRCLLPKLSFPLVPLPELLLSSLFPPSSLSFSSLHLLPWEKPRWLHRCSPVNKPQNQHHYSDHLFTLPISEKTEPKPSNWRAPTKSKLPSEIYAIQAKISLRVTTILFLSSSRWVSIYCMCDLMKICCKPSF